VKWFLSLAGVGLFLTYWRVRLSDAQLILARTLYGEARGEGRGGMEAVAAVIINRAAIGGWWGDSIISVAQKPWQFSTWNDNDPNRVLINDLKPGEGDLFFDLAYEIAGDAISGTDDPTGGATHYHALSVNPAWDDEMVNTANIGQHKFYKVA